jgi:vancomycin resistance protein YoaR
MTLAAPSTAPAKPSEPAPTGDYAVPGGAVVDRGGFTVSTDPAPTGPVPTVAIATATAAARAARTGRRRLRLGLLVPAGALVLLVAAWAADDIRTEGLVARGTVLGATPIGGLDSDGVDGILAQLDNELAMTSLQVRVGGASVNTDPATLGAQLDRELLHDRAMQARQGGFIALRPFRWVLSFFTEEEIDLEYTVDRATADEAVEVVLADVIDEPLEPELVLTGGEVTVRPGEEGSQLSTQEIVDLLPLTLEAGAPYEIELQAQPAAPALDDADVQAVADEITAATSADVAFQVLDDSVELEPAEIREWVQLDASGDEPTWRIDEDAALTDLKARFPGLGSEDQLARFSVVDGEPIIVPASETVVCCTPESVSRIRENLLEPPPPPDRDSEDGEAPTGEEPALRVVSLEPEVVGADEGVAELESLGIVEEVSSFTTNHDCCQNRVANIHRFADLIQGAIIRPGEDLSLNDYVGRRTVENGFVADGAIVNGVLEPQVGGGVSQFATTFFNAAFFAGLDFNEYQSHSLYISRYPRGREATISFPKPDLSVKNTTDYGILVWPTYTDTSITVTLYSTKHVEVQALDLLQSSQGQCSVFTTPRLRTYPDGTTAEDSVFALYRPQEGLDCNGNSTVPEDEPSGPTAEPGTPSVPPEPGGPGPGDTVAPASPDQAPTSG